VDSSLANAWTNKGAILNRLGRYNEALLALNIASELNPRDETTQNEIGVASYETVKYDDALLAFNNATDINPEYGLAWYNKGETLKSLGSTTEANTAFAKAKDLGYTG